MDDMGALWLASTPPETTTPDTGVPLWAFLLAAGLAVVGPFVTAWLTNRHTVKVLESQQKHEREMRLDEAKRKVYDEVLQVLGRAQFALALSTMGEYIMDVTAALSRLWTVGSGEVLVAAEAVKAEALEYTKSSHAAKNKVASPEAWQEFRKVTGRLEMAIKDDLDQGQGFAEAQSLLRDVEQQYPTSPAEDVP